MNSRGQAALEYLMTYGWALIVIAIVVGVLVFIVSSPAGNIVCNSNDPAKMMIKASQISSTGVSGSGISLGSIIVTNLTGGNITITTCTGSEGFAAAVGGCVASQEVTSGTQITMAPTPAAVAGTYATSVVDVVYTDYSSLTRTATITCSGPLTLS